MKKSMPIWMGVTRALLLGAVLWAVGAAMAAGKVGEMAPEWSGLKGLNGKSYDLKDYRGKVVLLMSVQYNCGGCKGNAPSIGKVARKFQGNSFQAFGADINFAAAKDLGSFGLLLEGKDTTLNFPLLTGLLKNVDIRDSLDSRNNIIGTLWIPYDALRDVYFVIDHAGKIVYRLDGNRAGALDSSKYVGLSNAIANAIANIPATSITSNTRGDEITFQVLKQNGSILFDLGNSGTGAEKDLSLKILDLQGRLIRTLDLNSAPNHGTRQVSWDGKDAKGNWVAWGNYFANVSSSIRTSTLMVSWLP